MMKTPLFGGLVAITCNSLEQFADFLLDVRCREDGDPWRTVSDVAGILPLCVIYNRPGFIAFFNTRTADLDVAYHTHRDRALALATALDYSECVTELYHARYADVSTLYNVVMVLIELAIDVDIVDGIFSTCLSVLCKRGHDINRCTGGHLTLAPIYSAIDSADEIGLAKIKILFDMGAEFSTNSPDSSAVLQMMLTKQLKRSAFHRNHGRGNTFASLVKLCLYQNPPVNIFSNDGVMDGFILHDKDLYVFGKRQGHGKHYYNAYRLVPILHELGCMLTQRHCSGHRDTEFTKTLQELLYIPRCLKDMCRNKLREAYTGRRIHRYVKQAGIPKSIQSYILLEELVFML